MNKIGQTLYILSDDVYLHCRYGAIEMQNKITGDKQSIALENVSNIIIFSHAVMSCDFVYACDNAHIAVTYNSPTGKAFGKFVGTNTGNVILRKLQFDMIDSEKELRFVKNLIGAKIHNYDIWCGYELHDLMRKHQNELPYWVTMLKRPYLCIKDVTP